jgi:hypothetical protein
MRRFGPQRKSPLGAAKVKIRSMPGRLLRFKLPVHCTLREYAVDIVLVEALTKFYTLCLPPSITFCLPIMDHGLNRPDDKRMVASSREE